MDAKKVRSRQPRERGFFECKVNGEKGMYVGTVDADVADPSIDAVHVVYIPLQDLNRGWFTSILSRFKWFERKFLWTKTEAAYPRSAVQEKTKTAGVVTSVGVFDREFKAVHDINGDAPYSREWSEGMSKTVERLERENKELKNKLAMADIDMQSMKSEDSTSSSPRSPTGQNRESDGSSFEDEFSEF